MTNKKAHGVLLAGVTAVSLAAIAQEDAGAPVGIKLAPGVRAVALLDADLAYTSNFFYQPDNEKSSVGVILKPGLKIEGDKGAFVYNLGLIGDIGKYDVRGDLDDYEDTRFDAGFTWDAATRHRFGARFIRLDDHDPFGTVRTESSAVGQRDLDEWHENQFDLTYRFGANDAKINVELGTGTRDREYDTNRGFTQFLDFSIDEVRAAVLYNLSSKTALLADIIDSDISYDENLVGFPRDGEEQRIRAGVRWKATGKTIGDVRVGKVKREFDDPAARDFDETDYDASLTWSPRVQTQLSARIGRASLESYLVETRFIDNEFYILDWTQDWSSLFRTSLSYGRSEQLFVDSAVDGSPAAGVQSIGERQDEIDSWTLLGTYRLSSSLQLRGGLSRVERTSNLLDPLTQRQTADYDNDTAFIGVRVLF
ncbi:MAG: outer membrane beta-barrel protein [Nevskiales bacterium]